MVFLTGELCLVRNMSNASTIVQVLITITVTIIWCFCRTEREPFDSADREIILAVNDPEQLDYVDALPMTDEEQDAKFSQVAGVSVFSSEGTTEAIYSAAGAVIRVMIKLHLHQSCQIYLSTYIDFIV